MAKQAITVQLPEDVYERVKRAARGMKQAIGQTLVTIVRAAMPSLEKVPPEYRAELAAMEAMGDEALWKVAETDLPAAQQRELTRLLRKNQKGHLTERERLTLARRRSESDRLMLRRSYAYVLLKCRGHRVPTLTELRQ